mgnify:CR=1 FL=1
MCAPGAIIHIRGMPMSTCKVCGKSFDYDVNNEICHSCAMNYSTLNRKCKKCGIIIVSRNQDEEYCAACKRDSSWNWKKIAEISASVVVFVGGTVWAIVKSRE